MESPGTAKPKSFSISSSRILLLCDLCLCVRVVSSQYITFNSCVRVCVCVSLPLPRQSIHPSPIPKRGNPRRSRLQCYPFGDPIQQLCPSVRAKLKFAFLPLTLSYSTELSILLHGIRWCNLLEKTCRNHGARAANIYLRYHVFAVKFPKITPA